MNAPHEMIRTAALANLLLHAEGAAAIGTFLESQRNPDGGFRGRAPGSDLYYTVFGLSSLAALNHPLPATSAAPFLAAADRSDLDFVHLASAARCHMLQSAPAASPLLALPFLHRLEAFRTGDGGYHHRVAHAATGTIYGAFLACLAYQEAGAPLPRQAMLLAGLETRRTADGGYANTAGVAYSTATATSAAILLQHWLDGSTDPAALAALQGCAHPAGGFLAFAGAPGPDLLSTATSLYALRIAGRQPASTAPHEAFIESLWDENGGFRGHHDDRYSDVEYTFYALMALGCCTPIKK